MSSRNDQIPDAVVEPLLDWADLSLRDLPWRQTRDPWKILVSEVMLQQTQVSRVIERFGEFIERFPTASACAAAPTSAVIELWSGMGYNRRAVNLWRAARVIDDEHGGKIPADLSALLALPEGKLNSIKKNYFLKFAYLYNKQSLLIFRNWLLDVTIFLFFSWFVIVLIPQMSILKIFFIELLLNLNEILKCFFLIFVLDLVVGFHSSKSWEISLYSTLGHFGFQIHQNQNLIAFFISIFPVFLDTISKYWVFRYLNKISPCTVLTYQAMIE